MFKVTTFMQKIVRSNSFNAIEDQNWQYSSIKMSKVTTFSLKVDILTSNFEKALLLNIISWKIVIFGL